MEIGVAVGPSDRYPSAVRRPEASVTASTTRFPNMPLAMSSVRMASSLDAESATRWTVTTRADGVMEAGHAEPPAGRASPSCWGAGAPYHPSIPSEAT